MRIAINALILKNNNTGTGYYTKCLIEELVKYDEHDFYIFVKDINLLHIDKANVKIIEISIANKSYIYRILAEQFLLKKYVIDNNIDIIHSTSFIIPWNISNIPNIVTVHDMFYKLYRHTIKPLNRLYYDLLFSRSIRKADFIISNSINTTKDIIDNLKISPNKIQSIYLGLNKTFTEFIEDDKLKHVFERLNLPKKYILFVGSLEPRKNLETVIKVFAKIKNECYEKLVVVGAKKWKVSDLNKLIVDLKLENDIVFTGYIEENILPYIYLNASLFLFPSLYEGFGFPLLEAMSMKTPIITSNISSLPEVIGNAGILVNPLDVEEISKKVLLILNDDELKNKITGLARERCHNFSWEKTANETLEVYKKVISDFRDKNNW